MQYRRIFAEGHSYFITMVTFYRKPLLIDHIEDLRLAFQLSKQRYAYDINAIIVLPDHLHMIITPKIADRYPRIISHIKRSFVYRLKQEIKDRGKMEISASKYSRQHAGIWQERYYEHTIRNEKDMIEKMEYIRSNAVKHGLAEIFSDWEYSSFYP